VHRLFSGLALAFFFLAAGLTLAGDRLGLSGLTSAGIASLGLSALSAGIQVIVTGEAFFLPAGAQALRRRAEHFTGLAARLWGIFFVLFGLVMLFLGLAGVFFPGQGTALLNRLLETPLGWGLVCVFFGGGLSLYGLTRLIGAAGRTGSGALDQVRGIGFRLFGLVGLLAGLGLCGLGVVLIFSPRLLTAWLKGLGLMPG
jgi:hypothetical protein